MRYIYVIILIFIIYGCAYSQADLNRYNKYGRIYISILNNSAFPSDERTSNITKSGKTYTPEENYSDNSVIVFVPKNLNTITGINIVFFFYGWMNSNYYSASTTDLIHQFIESKKNAIMVFPAMAKFAPDSFEGNFSKQDRFKDYVSELLDSLYVNKYITNFNLNSIILSAHSGGNIPVVSILKKGGMNEYIKEIYLLDALYGEKEVFLRWMKDYGGKLINVFTNGGGTMNNSLSLLDQMERNEIGFVYEEEANYSFTEYQSTVNLFLHTEKDHGAVLEKNLKLYLLMSRLDNIDY